MSSNEQKCPTCGAPLRFDPVKGKVVCDYCGAELDVREAAQANPSQDQEPKKPIVARKAEPKVPRSRTKLTGFDFSSLSDQAVAVDPAAIPVYNCVSCGAEVLSTPSQMALTCPYCGNNIVLTEKLSGALRPNGLIPFKIAPEALGAAVRRFYRGKKLLPKGFFENSRIGEVTGVYLPFWVFRGDLSGNLYYKGERSSSTRDGDYIVTTTDHYDLTRAVSLSFQDVPVAAEGRVDHKLMDSLEPFRMEDVRDFDIQYLAGFTADRFDRKKQGMTQRAQNRMAATAHTAAEAKAGAGYENVTRTGGNLKADMDAKYLLLPVYLFQILHGDQAYDFAVNGQTGKVVGALPIDKKTSLHYFLLRFGLVAGGILAASLACYFLGV